MVIVWKESTFSKPSTHENGFNPNASLPNSFGGKGTPLGKLFQTIIVGYPALIFRDSPERRMTELLNWRSETTAARGGTVKLEKMWFSGWKD